MLTGSGAGSLPNSRMKGTLILRKQYSLPILVVSRVYGLRNSEGAYSTIDKLLEIMMSKPYGTNNTPQEHKNFKMLIKTEVRKILVDNNGAATGVVVTNAKGGPEQTISLKSGGSVVLAAGSVASPAILLRSKLNIGAGAGQVTDHDILFRSLSFRYLNPERRKEVGAMKLQTYFDMGLPDHRVGLANMSIDASSFLPRGNTQDKNLAQMIMAFILPCPLEEKNSVTMVADEPKVSFDLTDITFYLKLTLPTTACR